MGVPYVLQEITNENQVGPKKSEWLKKHPKRNTSFEEARIILDNPSQEIGGDLKCSDPEQYYSVGIAANDNIVTLIYNTVRHEYCLSNCNPLILLH